MLLLHISTDFFDFLYSFQYSFKASIWTLIVQLIVRASLKKDVMRTHLEFLDSLYSFQIQIEGELSALRCRIVRDQFNRIQSPVVCCLPIQAPISCVGWLTLKNIKIGFNSSVPGIPPVPPISHFYSHLFSQARAALSEIEWLVSDISHEQQHSCSLYCCPEGPPPPS